MIPDSFIQELLERVDIVDVVSRYVNLRKGGANLIGLCPFHNEKTPSFTVSPNKQFYHCFGCGAHGSALRFLTEHTGQSFPDAVQSLADSVGLAVPKENYNPVQARKYKEHKAQVAVEKSILELALGHYKKHLKNSKPAIDYLKSRGISGQIAARYGLGWAGSERRGLATVFENYESSALLDSGLVIDADDGSRYDRFRSRVMFPINNSKGTLIGFGGRLIEPGEPKYLNSPETSLFSKGKELYGLYEARAAIRKEAYVLVVEGYMDVVKLAQHGIENAVATLGTATTAEHIQKLKRTTDNIVFSFDGDKAGRNAAWRALQTCLPWLAEDLGIRFLFLPEGYDPDSYVSEFGVEATRMCINEAQALSTFMLQELQSRHNMAEAEGRSACVHEARPLFGLIPDGGYKVQLKREFAANVRLTPEELDDVLQSGEKKRFSTGNENSGIQVNLAANTQNSFKSGTLKKRAAKRKKTFSGNRMVMPIAKRLLGLLLAYPVLVKSLGDQQLEIIAGNPNLVLVKEMINLVGYCGATHAGTILEAVDPDSDLANALQDLSTELLIQELPDPAAEWNDAIRQIEIQTLQDQCESLIASGLSTVEQQNYYKVLIKRLALLKSTQR